MTSELEKKYIFIDQGSDTGWCYEDKEKDFKMIELFLQHYKIDLYIDYISVFFKSFVCNFRVGNEDLHLSFVCKDGFYLLYPIIMGPGAITDMKRVKKEFLTAKELFAHYGDRKWWIK